MELPGHKKYEERIMDNVEKLVQDIEKNGVIACVGKPRAINGTLDLLCKIIRFQHEALKAVDSARIIECEYSLRVNIDDVLEETNRLAGEIVGKDE